MSDDATATEPTIEETADSGNPFDAIREQEATPDAGAPEATPIVEEQADPSSSTTDQPTTTEPKEPNPLVNPLAEALAKPVATAPAKPAAVLPPELAAIAQDPERLKQLLNQVQLAGRQATELGQLRQQTKRYEGLPDPEQVRQIIQEREATAKVQNLKPWNRDHPGHQKFVANRESIARDYKRLERTAPENREAVKRELLADYTPEQLADYDQYQSWRQEQESEAPEAREDRIYQMARQAAAQEFEQRMQYEQQKRQTQEYLAKNPEVLGANREIFERALDSNVSRRELAEEIVALKAQLSQSTGQRAKDLQVVDTAKARDQIVKQTAVVGRDTNGRKPKVNPMKVADDAALNDESPLQALARLHASESINEP